MIGRVRLLVGVFGNRTYIAITYILYLVLSCIYCIHTRFVFLWTFFLLFLIFYRLYNFTVVLFYSVIFFWFRNWIFNWNWIMDWVWYNRISDLIFFFWLHRLGVWDSIYKWAISPLPLVSKANPIVLVIENNIKSLYKR